MCLCTRVVLLVLLQYVQRSASQIVNKDDGVLFDYYGEKRLFLPNDTDNVKNKSVTVQDKMDCVFSCVNVSWCRSVNFQTTPLASGLHLCELLSLDHRNNTKYLNESKVFHHYSIKSPCEEKPCFNGAECIAVDRQGYRCNCKQGFEGLQCEKEPKVTISTNCPFDSIEKSVYSPNYPSNYGNNASCYWKLTSATKVSVTFVRFNTEAKRDVVRIYDGPSARSPMLKDLSGEELSPGTIVSSGNYMHITFTSDGSNVMGGFKALYWVLVETSLSCCGSSLNITSPYYPNNYGSNMAFSWNISSSKRMLLTFASFDTESGKDFVRIYDGPSSSSPKLIELSGNQSNIEPICSSGNYLYIIFNSYYFRGEHNGFLATIQDLFEKSLSCCSKPPLYIMMMYPNNYGINMAFSWNISSSKKMLLIFDDLYVESGFNFVRIYDGPSSSSPKLIELSGKWSNIDPICSSGNYLYIIFKPDPLVVYNGFEAIILDLFETSLSCCSPSFNITSPYYPNKYGINMAFSWNISSSKRMVLTFESFATGRYYDFVRIYDGPSSSSPKLIELSGKRSNIEPIRSSGNYLYIIFNSYYFNSGDHNGFLARIQEAI